MDNNARLQEKRSRIIREISEIETMRKGCLNAKYNNVRKKDGTVAKSGPFYTLTSKGEGNKTVSESVPSGDVDRMRREVDNHRRFRELAKEYVEVCEELSALGGEGSMSKKN
jgi:hypothetical protein